MDAYCVDCGQQNIPEDIAWRVFRCPPCWKRFKLFGGIQKIKEPIVEIDGAITMGGGYVFSNYAKFCRLCGRSLRGSEKRVRFALLRGGECHTCNDCYYKKRYPEPNVS